MEIGDNMDKNPKQPTMEELKAQMFGNNDDTNQDESLKDMAKKLFGDAGIGGGDSNEMIDKTAQNMINEFNGMLSQVTFGILLEMVTPEQQIAIKNQLYTSWKSRMDEGVDDSKSTGDDSGLAGLFGIGDIMGKSIVKADIHIKDFLGLNDTK